MNGKLTKKCQVIVNEIIVDQVLTPFELIESQELKLELD
jgi:hypothetical protein